jgi:hypothetical protein
MAKDELNTNRLQSSFYQVFEFDIEFPLCYKFAGRKEDADKLGK